MATIPNGTQNTLTQDFYGLNQQPVAGVDSVFLCQCNDDGVAPLKVNITVTVATPHTHGTVLAGNDGINWNVPTPGAAFLLWAVVDEEPLLLPTDVLPIVKQVTIRRASRVRFEKLIFPLAFTAANRATAIELMLGNQFTGDRAYNA
jgi:hypothetical protein